MSFVETNQERCQNCGGVKEFDAVVSAIVCRNCGGRRAVERKAAKRQSLEVAIRGQAQDKKWTSEVEVMRCNSCGATEIFRKGNISDVCPFCHSVHIDRPDEGKGNPPGGIIPFKISREQAFEAIDKKVKSNKWASRAFKDTFRVDTIKGLYTPVYCFDSKVEGGYSARVGETFQVRKNINGQWHTVNEVRWRTVNGRVNQVFEDILIEAGNKVSTYTLRELEPYNVKGALAFDISFLKGFSASCATKEIQQGFNQAKAVMDGRIRELIKRLNNAALIQDIQINVRHNNTQFKYLLMPIYVATFNHKGKAQNLFVNGESGKVVGRLPKGSKKVAGAIIGGALLAAAGVLIYLFASGILG